jgi:type 1 glutamine amidotransferase
MKRRIALLVLTGAIAHGAGPSRVLIVVGPSKHPPGTHEAAAGGRAVQYFVEHMTNVPDMKADVVYEWPEDKALRDKASTVVFIGDAFPANRFPDAARNLSDLEEMMNRGCGLIALHFATGLFREHIAPDCDHPLLRWMGGYFASRGCAHHKSIAKVYPAATITPAAPGHPVSRGWREFTVHDEPYINNYFGKEENRPAPNVTALATSMLPPESPKRETVAWGVERADGGRGFGIVMPHFYKNWVQPDLRRFIMNAIVWTSRREVPPGGVETPLPDLAQFGPEAVDFVPRNSKSK